MSAFSGVIPDLPEGLFKRSFIPGVIAGYAFAAPVFGQLFRTDIPVQTVVAGIAAGLSICKFNPQATLHAANTGLMLYATKALISYHYDFITQLTAPFAAGVITVGMSVLFNKEPSYISSGLVALFSKALLHAGGNIDDFATNFISPTAAMAFGTGVITGETLAKLGIACCSRQNHVIGMER